MKLIRNFVFVFAFTTFLVSSADIPSKFECLGAYVKSKGITNPAFDSITYDSSMEECMQLRQKFISEIRQEIRSKINDVEILPKYSKCIYDKMAGSESFVNSLITAAALESIGEIKAAGKFKNSVDTILEYIKSSVIECKIKTDFGDEFDALFEAEKKAVKNVTDYEKEYCVKKYLVKNNLIDTTAYIVELNPHRINVTGLNCEETIKKSNDDVYEQLGFVYLENSNLGNIEKVECALEKFREADYFDLMTKISALTTLSITPEQRLDERENFIRILSKISSNISTC